MRERDYSGVKFFRGVTNKTKNIHISQRRTLYQEEDRNDKFKGNILLFYKAIGEYNFSKIIIISKKYT